MPSLTSSSITGLMPMSLSLWGQAERTQTMLPQACRITKDKNAACNGRLWCVCSATLCIPQRSPNCELIQVCPGHSTACPLGSRFLRVPTPAFNQSPGRCSRHDSNQSRSQFRVVFDNWGSQKLSSVMHHFPTCSRLKISCAPTTQLLSSPEPSVNCAWFT